MRHSGLVSILLSGEAKQTVVRQARRVARYMVRSGVKKEGFH
jgi:hypothetical protein